jgi:ferredoxin
MHIKVDVEKCIGAGQCVNAAPTVFAQNEDDGMVVLLDEAPSAEKAASVRSAIRLCPARAILEAKSTAVPATAAQTKDGD